MKEWLLIFIVFQLSVVVGIFAILVIQKVYTEKREKKKTFLKKGFLDIITHYIVNDMDDSVHLKTNLEYDAFAEVCIDILGCLSGDTAEKVRVLIKRVSLGEHYMRMATSPFWMKRFFAIERLGLFFLDELKEFFIDSYHRERVYSVKIRTVTSLSFIADEESLRLITRALATEISISSKFNAYIYANIIMSFRRKGLLDKFLKFLDEQKDDTTVPILVKRDIIEACGSSEVVEARQAIMEYFSLFHTNAEMRIACIRASGRLGTSDNRDAGTPTAGQDGWWQVITSGLTDEDWRVRAVAAGAASICSETVIPLLLKLLYDSVYHVRVNAGRALARLGTAGIAALKGEVDSNDRFVRDTVRFILR